MDKLGRRLILKIRILYLLRLLWDLIVLYRTKNILGIIL